MRIRAAILLPLLFVSPRLLAQPGPEIAASITARKLSGRAIRLSGEKPLTLESRAAAYSLIKGTLWEVVTSKGEALGYFFKGEGNLRWKRSPALAETGVSAAPGDELAKQLGKFLKADERGAEFRFQEASFLSAGVNPLKVPAAWEAQKPPSDALQKHGRRFENPFLPPVDPALATALVEKDRPFFAAQLEGKKDLVHHEDGVFSGEALLWVVSQGAPALLLDSWSVRERSGWMLNSVELDIRELERSHGLGLFRVTEEIRLEEAASVLVFALLSDPPFTPSPVFFDSLSEEKLGDLPFILKNGRLFVFLPETLPAGTSLSLRMRYQGGLLPRYEPDRLGWELPGHQAWYPRPARFENVRATFRGTVRSRKPSQPLAPGQELRRWVDGGWNALEFQVKRPRPSLSLLAGCYNVGGTPSRADAQGFFSWLVSSPAPFAPSPPAVTAHGFCGQPDVWEAAVVDLVTRISLASADVLGGVPGTEIRIVERDASADEMDSQSWGLTLGNLVAARKSPSLSEASRMAGRVLQGIWLDGIRPRRRQDTWVIVALANISALEVLEKIAPSIKTGGLVESAKERSRQLFADLRRTPATLLSEMGDPEMKNELKGRVRVAAAQGPDAPDGLNAPRTPLVRGHALASHAAGLVVMDAIRSRMGREAFGAFLKSFLKERREAGEMGLEDLLDALNRATGDDWYPWFERYIYANELPEAAALKKPSPTPGTGQP